MCLIIDVSECCSVLVEDFFIWRKLWILVLHQVYSFFFQGHVKFFVFCFYYKWLHYVGWVIAFTIGYWGRVFVVQESFRVSILFDYKYTFRLLSSILSASMKLLAWLGGRWISIGPIQNRCDLLYHINFIYNSVNWYLHNYFFVKYFMLCNIFLFTYLLLAPNW